MAKGNVGTVLTRCGKRQCRHSARTVWQTETMSAQFSHGVAKNSNVGRHVLTISEEMRKNWRHSVMDVFPVWILRDALVTDRFDLAAFAVDCVVSRNQIQLFTWGFQGIVVFPSVCCVPKCFCFLRPKCLCLLCSQVFLFLACPSVCVCCVPKCFCFLRAQVFVSVVLLGVQVFCVPKRLCLFCSQAFVSAVCQNVSVCCALMVVLLRARVFMFLACPSVQYSSNKVRCV